MAQGPREAFSQSHSSESGSVLMNHPLKVVLVHRDSGRCGAVYKTHNCLTVVGLASHTHSAYNFIVDHNTSYSALTYYRGYG